MPHYPYVIIGGGMAAAAAVEGIREVDEDGAIALLSADTEPPYDRPPLSKALWKGDTTVDQIMRPLDENVDFRGGRTVTQLMPDQRFVTDDLGTIYNYDKLLLATGSTPRRLPFGGDNIIYYRTLDSYHRLRELADKHDKFAVIGGGFIGSEIAAALAMNGKQVTILFPRAGIASNIFPADVVEFLNGYYRDKGVEVLAGQEVREVEGRGTDLTVVTASGRRIAANGVVAGVGVTPNVELAQVAGLEVENGVVVNRSLQTSHRDIYAAGDVASFTDEVLGTRRRVEHEDAANSMGKAAGRAMAGAEVNYTYSPMFYSDLFELGYEAVGNLSSKLDVVADWQKPYDTGVLYYLDEKRVRGVLLWNVWGKVDEARVLIAEGKEVSPDDLRGRIQPE
ncbi:MAG: FAD-dependent oxidoreductase [Caldilineaceae bacterium]|nr:FAD-dependent oxidoreductase [Caldilineaceae bacterium]